MPGLRPSTELRRRTRRQEGTLPEVRALVPPPPRRRQLRLGARAGLARFRSIRSARWVSEANGGAGGTDATAQRVRGPAPITRATAEAAMVCRRRYAGRC